MIKLVSDINLLFCVLGSVGVANITPIAIFPYYVISDIMEGLQDLLITISPSLSVSYIVCVTDINF
jgi:hypothetical protein